MKYLKLFQPCRIGEVELPNRVVMLPITTNFAREGYVTDCLTGYYVERGRGGVGLIIVEDIIVDSSTGRHAYNDLLIDDDKYVPSLHHLVQAIKIGGAKVALNLSHAGRAASRAYVGRGMSPVAPSPVPESPGSMIPRELGIEEIDEIEDKFAQAALRAKEAGSDLLSLQGAHGYLISQFLSPAVNQRKDIYGRDIEGRLRFLLRIIRKIKSKVGNDYPLMVRINGEERAEGGLTIENAKEISCRLEAEGVSCISVSVDTGVKVSRRDIPPNVAPMQVPRGCMVHLAPAMKQVVSIPVMAANRIVTPQLADEILEQGKADLIGIGRGLVADPEWPRKAKEGRADEIRHCLACQYCLSCVVKLREMRCAVNVAAGREMECKMTPATKSKIVFIAGGGPAGLEAARVSSIRGHKVSLFEKKKLGGQLNLACIPPGKDEIRTFLNFEEKQLKKLRIKVEHRELTSESIKQAKPDAVIVATGAKPLIPSLPGIKKKNVVNAWEVLEGKVTTGSNVVVLGGGQVGVETAEFLAEKGKRVTIVEMLREIATDALQYSRELLLASLNDLNVKILTLTRAKEITDSGVEVERDGKQEFMEADSVVIALGTLPNQKMTEQIRSVVHEVYVVGDCAAARKLPNAVEEGFMAGLKL